MVSTEKYFPKQELAELEAIIAAAKPEHFRMIVMKANKLLGLVWRKHVDKPLFYRGTKITFTDEQRQELFAIRHLPTVDSFAKLKTLVEQLSQDNPAKQTMLTAIEMLTPIVLIVQGLSTKKVYENASLRTGE